MVCPNCHSDQIIAVQDQHFCINCGQMVPDTVAKTTSSPTPKVAVQDNGLPEGVKILPLSTSPSASPSPTATRPNAQPNLEKPVAENAPAIIKPRTRIAATSPEATPTEPETPTLIKKTAASTLAVSKAKSVAKPKKRTPGRPKAGRLDTPRVETTPAAASSTTIAITTTAIPSVIEAKPLPDTPLPKPNPSIAPSDTPRRMNDLAPRKTTPNEAIAQNDTPAPKVSPSDTKPSRTNRGPKQRSATHRHPVPPLHYAPVLSSSLKERVRPHYLGLAALGAVSFAAAIGYGAWLVLHDGPARLTSSLANGGIRLLIEVALLACLYYIGRSLGQGAIIYGASRQADQRPVTLAHQLSVAINTFGRRLRLDLGFCLAELGLLALIVALLFTGGASWPVHHFVQYGLIFCAYLILLYLLTSLAITRGLAGVALILTADRPWHATKFAWRLFSHRFELLALRFTAAAFELVLATPLIALAAVFIVGAPAGLELVVTIGVGLLAWLAGALFGAGTASWWAALYRQLILTDHPDGAPMLLAAGSPPEAHRGPLALIVGLSGFLLAAILATPWLNIF